MNGNSETKLKRGYIFLAATALFLGTASMIGALPPAMNMLAVGIAGVMGLFAAVGLLGTSHAPLRPGSRRRDEMRAIIGPFYATLQRRVKAQEDEQPWEDEAQSAKTPATGMAGEPAPEEFEFNAGTAAIVQDEERSYMDEAHQFVYEMKRYARSPEGEYFWMILEVLNGKPQLTFIKHVPHRVARVTLGKKYVAPPPRFA